MLIIGLLIQFIIMILLNILGVSSDLNTYLFMIMNIIYITIFFLIRYRDIFGYLLIAYFGRLIFLFWDIYARHIYILPGSGNDTEGFYQSALMISNNISLLQEQIYGGIYSKILGFLFYWTGGNRILGQYLNVLLGLGIILLTYMIFKKINIKESNINLSILIISLFPNSLIFSSILLRENIITFLVTLSAYYFISWYEDGNFRNALLSLIVIGLTSVFHSGVIGVLLGYLLTYIFYNRDKNLYNMSLKSVILLIVAIVISLVLLGSKSPLLGKFSKINNVEDIVNTANSRRGGSQYLSSISINSIGKMILFSPIYGFYFLASPLPWGWRGGNDILTFFMDSLIYIYIIYYIYIAYKNYEDINSNRYIIIALGLSIFSTVLIFGIGVSNAGTAMRHRHKILPLLIILVTILKDSLSHNSSNIKTKN